MREVALEAIARARRGDGPTLIECETYRFRGHSLADPDELRSKDEKAHYAARDPIPQLRKYMLEQGLATEADIKEIEAKVWRARVGPAEVWGLEERVDTQIRDDFKRRGVSCGSEAVAGMW